MAERSESRLLALMGLLLLPTLIVIVVVVVSAGGSSSRDPVVTEASNERLFNLSHSY